MVVLTIRTDKPRAEIGLYDDTREVAYVVWEAHRQLAETVHQKIKAMLDQQKLDWSDIQGIVCFQGPGSFTGLRIGLSVVNALGYSLDVPIAGTTGDDWCKDGMRQLADGVQSQHVLPIYGQEPHITAPRK